MKVLEACEEELVCELSTVNAVEMCKAFFQACVITRDMSDNFTSLDHSRLEPQLQIRYLLRLVRMNIKTDVTAWGKFLILLAVLERISTTLIKKLKKPMPQINEGPTEVSETTSSSTDTAGADASVEEEIVLSHGDVGLVTELLVPISHKWEVISISLGFQQYDIANFRKDDNKFSLSNSIGCWISRDSNPTLKKLMHALKSRLVGAGRMAMDLEKGFKEAKKQSDNTKKREQFKTEQSSNFSDTTLSFTISKTSYHTEVADGKSTLLLVQASPREAISYQWNKDGHPLPNSSTYSGVHDDILVVNHASQGTEGEYICCVSRQGKEVCTNKITLTVLYEAAKKRLINLYSAKSVIPEDTWPPTASKVFINLALIKYSKDDIDIIDYAIRGDADDIIAKKEEVEYKEVFGEYNSKELILLEGRPGSGKTTLVHKVIKDWAQGEVLAKAKYLFFVTLRLLNSEGRDETLSDLLQLFYSNDEELKTTRDYIEKNDGEGVCFVIDGLDEYQPQNKKKSVIYKLLDKTSLPRAMIIVSSRPSATPTLKKDVITKQIEVFGFSKQTIFKYIDNFKLGSSPAGKLKEYLVSNPNILDMCYLPVHAAMICFLFKYDQGCTSCTQTKIYEQFTRLIIHRHLTRHNADTELPSLKELHGMPKKYFDDLCRLAFNMITDSKQVISPHELGFQLSPCAGSHGDDEYSLGLVTVYHTIHLTGRHQNYAFLHLTFQEFLAAYHIANLDTSQQMEIIEQYSKSKHMRTVWTFYCGLVNFQSGLMRFKNLTKYIYSRDILLLIRFGYESQQLDVCDEVVKHLNGSLRFDYLVTPTDVLAISYVIATTSQPVTQLVLSPQQNDDTLKILLAPLSQKNLHNLKNLGLSPPIYGEHLFMLINILKSATNLETITLRIKDFGPDEAEGLVGQLKQLSSLKSLDLRSTAAPNSIHVLVKALSSLSNVPTTLSFEDVDTEGALALGSALQFHTSTNLRELDLSNSNIGPEGVTGLANGLRCLTALPRLTFENNEIRCDGFNSFWNAIQNLNSLETLHLSHNNIVDDDLKFLIHSNSLQHLTRLASLTLSRMNYGSDWSCLVELRHLTNIRYLNLSHNAINSDGAANLACALQYLTTLEGLCLTHNNIGRAGMTALSKGLLYLTNLYNLELSHNDIGPADMTALSKGLLYLTNLEKLDLSDNDIGPAGMTALSKGLLYLTNLRVLHLSHNDIDLEGAKAVITSLKGCPRLYLAFINRERKWHSSDGIVVQGLISPDNTSAIADLVAAAECATTKRRLVLGFKTIDIPPKGQGIMQLASHIISNVISNWNYYTRYL